MAKILIADDDSETRSVLRHFLSSPSYEILEANDGTAALESSRAHRPDIILLDISMPKRDGVEVLKELVPELPETGFVMITGNEDETVALACLEFGAFDYVSKPINLDLLGEIIKARLLAQK